MLFSTLGHQVVTIICMIVWLATNEVMVIISLYACHSSPCLVDSIDGIVHIFHGTGTVVVVVYIDATFVSSALNALEAT